MPTFADFQNRVAVLLQDAAGELSTANRDELIKQAIQQRYSKDEPRELASDVAGNGTSDLPLPSIYEEGFSTIRQIEFPIGNLPPTLLADDDWHLYRKPTGLVMQLLSTTPAATDNVRLTLTGRHSSDGSTVPAPDFEAVCDYAAALSFDALAAKFAQLAKGVLGADVVSYQSKSDEYLRLGKVHKARYFQHLGIDPDDAGAQAGPAIALGELDLLMGSGVDRMTHSKRTR